MAPYWKASTVLHQGRERGRGGVDVSAAQRTRGRRNRKKDPRKPNDEIRKVKKENLILTGGKKKEKESVVSWEKRKSSGFQR